MMKNLKRLASLFLAVLTLISLFDVPASAATSPAVAGAVLGKLPMVTYAMPLSGVSRIYSYSDSTLGTQTSGYYIDTFIDQIVIVEVSADGKAVLVTYPSTSAKSGFRTRWFKTEDVIGLMAITPTTYTASARTTTYRMSGYSSLKTFGYIDSGDSCVVLGARMVGGNTCYVYAYPISTGTYNKVSGVKYKIGLSTTAPSTMTGTAASTSYATYTGVNYHNLTSDSRRIAACNKAVQMATILWKADCSFPTWKSSGGIYNTVTATDGTSSTKFLQGKMYQGIPYSMAGRTYDDTKWSVLVQSGLTSSSMTCYYAGRTNTTAKGVDCSYLVCTALNTGCGTSIDLNTVDMLNSSMFRKISRSQMLPGDIFLTNGHVMFFMGQTADGKYAVIEANADYSRVMYRELSASSIASYGCYRYNGFL